MEAKNEMEGKWKQTFIWIHSATLFREKSLPRNRAIHGPPVFFIRISQKVKETKPGKDKFQINQGKTEEETDEYKKLSIYKAKPIA